MKDADQTQRGDEAQGALRWISALPDAAAFLAGLAIAWYMGWNTRDLVWSLWLSSLLVGYSIIVWKIFGPALRDFPRQAGEGVGLGSRFALAGIRVVGGFFLLIFFFAHFARLENFAVYAGVYAVYFFPWKLVRGARARVAGPQAATS